MKIWRKTTGASHAAENFNEKSATFVVAGAAKGGEDPMGRRYMVYGLFTVVLRGVRLCDKVSEEENGGEVKIGEVRLGVEE